MYLETKFDAQFSLRLLENIQQILERDTELAIRELDDTLDLFKEFKTPTLIALNFPALYVSVSGSQLAQSDDDDRVQGQHTFFVDVAVVGNEADAFTLQPKLLKYVLACDRVLRTMTASDLTGGVTSAVGQPAWEVTEHQFGALRGLEGSTILRLDARLVLVVQLLER